MQLWQWLLPVTAAFFFFFPPKSGQKRADQSASSLARSPARSFRRQSSKAGSLFHTAIQYLLVWVERHHIPYSSSVLVAAPLRRPPAPQLSRSYIRLSIQRRAPQQNNKQLLKHSGRLDSACCRCPSISWPHSRSRRRKKIYSKVLKVFSFIILLTLFGTMQSAAAPIEEDIQSPRFSFGAAEAGPMQQLSNEGPMRMCYSGSRRGLLIQ